MKLKHIAAISLLAAAPGAALAAPAINGAGATFPAPIYQRWFQDYANASGDRVNYQSVGSGAGIRQFVAGTVDFGASDEPIKTKEAAKVKRGVVQIPMVGGTIAVAYNKAGCKLKLTQKQTVDIFSGRINDWKQVGCAAGRMTVVHLIYVSVSLHSLCFCYLLTSKRSLVPRMLLSHCVAQAKSYLAP